LFLCEFPSNCPWLLSGWCNGGSVIVNLLSLLMRFWSEIMLTSANSCQFYNGDVSIKRQPLCLWTFVHTPSLPLHSDHKVYSYFCSIFGP
jgi:hypothetical protein